MAGIPGPAEPLLAEGRRRYEAGDVADAEPLARRALELLPASGDPLARAIPVHLGECAFSLGRDHEAASPREPGSARSRRRLD